LLRSIPTAFHAGAAVCGLYFFDPFSKRDQTASGLE
jgi:hypothetical protein